MDDARSRLEQVVEGDRRSGLELIVGSARYVEELILNSTMWIAGMVVGGVVSVLLAGDALGLNRAGVATVISGCVAMALVIRAIGNRAPPVFFALVAISAGGLCALLLWFAGPGLAVTAAVIPAYIAAASLFFSRRTTVIATAIALATYGLIVLLDTGYPRPWARLTLVATATIATASVISRFVERIERLATSERGLHEEVARARAQLEARVTEQVDEIDRLSKLRRFLSPQVANTVLSTGGEELLATHRRQIAVIFIDLRGFTAFSAVAEPEDVVEVLSEFYAAVGEVVKRLDATVGGFAGDGVMAYFNDPVPCEDPAGRALDMALSLRDPMALLKDRWRDRGFDIGYGAGIAYGYATLGTIGFEERTDYTPIGSVVNLASRLCDEAADGEILLDSRAHTAVRERAGAGPVDLDLKGFAGPVTAYRVAVA